MGVVVDMHTHTFSPAAEALARSGAPLPEEPYRRDMSEASKATDVGMFAEIRPKFGDLELRRADMRRMGVGRQVVIPAPGQFHYGADPALGAAAARTQNDWVAELVGSDSGHFVGMGTLPMQDPVAAVDEATRGVRALDLRGFQIDTRVGEVELSDARFDPLYERLSELAVPLFVHPLGFSHGQRLGPYFMVNSVGQPIEETLAIAHLILGGVLDRHPALRVCVAHGGGYLPYYAGRMDHAWEVRPEVRRLLPEPPSTYLRRLWFDTCVFRADTLEYLVRLVGADRVMLGSDYPFDMGDPDPLATVEACAALSADEREAIVGGNALRLFGIV